jgi:hypothetical protein
MPQLEASHADVEYDRLELGAEKVESADTKKTDVENTDVKNKALKNTNKED